MSALEVRRVCKTRGAGVHTVEALRGVSLSLAPGEFVLVEGPSGSGKTTLLCVAAGLLTPESGEVVLDGTSLARMTAGSRRSHRARAVGFVFQRSNLLENLSVRENIMLAASLAGIPRDAAKRESDWLMDVLGIGHLADRRPDTISGGEEQRAAVARALVHRPPVVLADEPTGNLDSESGCAVASALAELARASDVGVLVATHDPRLHPFATRRLRLVDGSIADNGG